MRRDARARGIPAATVDAGLAGLALDERVLELDARQPERSLSFADYRARVLNEARVRRGRELLAANRPLLERTATRYGVPARVLVALWGLESSFGERTGRLPVVASLATLAYGGRRAAFFREQLLDALEVLAAERRSPAALQGSWAGAMGQCQFMPGTFLRFAVDADGDGRRDIWGSLPDIFASAANYLARSGWQGGLRWGRPVAPLPPALRAPSGLEHRLPLARWRDLGLRTPAGAPVPRSRLLASLVQPDGPGGDAFLAYGNFRTVMIWNRSTYFALTVGLFSDLLEDSPAGEGML